MTLANVLSLAALESDESPQPATGPRVVRLRTQVAVVRALADQVEHFSRTGDSRGLSEQLTQEKARLERQLLEVADTAGRDDSR